MSYIENSAPGYMRDNIYLKNSTLSLNKTSFLLPTYPSRNEANLQPKRSSSVVMWAIETLALLMQRKAGLN